MKWYYKQLGKHIHVRVFMNGAVNGTLIFNIEEFEYVMAKAMKSSPHSIIESFIEDEV